MALDYTQLKRLLSSTFYEDLRGLLFTMLDEENVDTDYIPPDVPNANNYPVDYHFAGSDGKPVFLYGVPGRDKARLTTIMLSHFLLHRLTFESVIVFADQQEIPRLDLARLTNVAGTAVASLDAEQDLRRKIERLAARAEPSRTLDPAALRRRAGRWCERRGTCRDRRRDGHCQCHRQVLRRPGGCHATRCRHPSPVSLAASRRLAGRKAWYGCRRWHRRT